MVALGLVSCAPSSAADVVRVPGTVADAPAYVNALQESPVPDAYLIIEVRGTPDFLQLTASPEGSELDMPLITQRQRMLEPRFRSVATDLGLAVRERRGSDGSRFLDIDLPVAPAAGALVQEFVTRFFELGEQTQLVFACHGCTPKHERS
jgi:hypothetical protein